MIEIEEIDDGVFKVTMTSMHYSWLDECCKKLGLQSEIVLSFWLANGLATMTLLGAADNPTPIEPPESSGHSETDDG